MRQHQWNIVDAMGVFRRCAHCGLDATPGLENPMQMEYVAFHDKVERRREWEPVPPECPLPEHLMPGQRRRPKRVALATDSRWTLWRQYPSEQAQVAEWWFRRSAEVFDTEFMTADLDSKRDEYVSMMVERGAVTRLFVRMNRERLPELDAAIEASR